MRIAVIPPRVEESCSYVERFLILNGIRFLLSDHHLVITESPEDDSKYDLQLFLGDRVFKEAAWSPWVLDRSTPSCLVNLSVDPACEWSDEQRALLKKFSKQGGISVIDATSFRKIKEVTASPYVGGHCALFSSTAALKLRAKAKVFCPSDWDPAFAGKQRALQSFLKRYYLRMNRSERALFLAHSSAELRAGAGAGISTLFCPDHPLIHLKALASASAVVGSQTASLMAALACRVPAVFVGSEPQKKNAVETAGIPFLHFHLNTSASELEHRVDETLRKYPWSSCDERVEKLKQDCFQHFKELGLKPRESKKQRRTAQDPLTVASIVHEKNLCQFLGLVENLAEVHSGDVIHEVLALDSKTEKTLEKLSSVQLKIHTLSTLFPSIEMTLISFPKWAQSRVLRPRFLQRLVEKQRCGVLWCEPDVFFYQSPAEVLSDLRPTVVFPQWSDEIPSDNRAPFECRLLWVGKTSEPFLDWWKTLVEASIKTNPLAAAQEVPSFLSALPALFPSIQIYPSPDMLGHSRAVDLTGIQESHWPGEAPRLVDLRPLKCLISAEQGPVCFDSKTVWDQLVAFFVGPLDNSILAPLFARVLLQQRRYWEDLDAGSRWVERLREHLPWVPRLQRAWHFRFVLAVARFLGTRQSPRFSLVYPAAAPTAPRSLWATLVQAAVFSSPAAEKSAGKRAASG